MREKNGYFQFNLIKDKDIYGKIEELDPKELKKRIKNNVVYSGMLKASECILGRELEGEITPNGCKIPKDEMNSFEKVLKKKFTDLEKLKELLKKEKKLMEEVDNLLEKGEEKKALEKGEKLVGLIFWTIKYREETINIFRERLNIFLDEKDDKEVEKSWLRLMVPTKKLYSDEMVDKIIEGERPLFLEKLKSSEELKDFPEIERERKESVAYEELRKISKFLTKEQREEVKEWLEAITMLQEISEVKNYYWPKMTSLKD